MKGYVASTVEVEARTRQAISDGHETRARLTEARRQRVVELRNLGLSQAEIGRRLKISPITVRRDLKRGKQ